MNIAEYLLRRLKSLGVDHVFGIPGDYILPFFEVMADSDVTHIAPCNELNGGYAADGYARLRGLSAVAVTYGPGSFSLVNAVAGAYAERAPVVVISGGPPTELYESQPYMHHILPDNYEASMRIFEQITVGARVLKDAKAAPADIDELLRLCLAESRPVYLEIPRDVQFQACAPPGDWSGPEPGPKDAAATEAAVELLTRRLSAANRCVLLVGHEIHSAGLQDDLLALVEKTGIPVASMFSGKPEFLEHHPRCIGIYHGLGSLDAVREFVEGADAVVWLGAVPSDFNKGGSTAKLTDAQNIVVFDDKVVAAEGAFSGVTITDVVTGLLDGLPAGRWSDLEAPVHGFSHKADHAYEPVPDQPMTNERFFARIARFLETGDVVFADAGPSINMAYVQLPAESRYIASCYWASIGAGFGYTLGACFAAAPDKRIIALEGDGAFQMTAQELSTMIRYGKTPIVFVINNRGYTAERLIHDGPFNDIQNWRYHRLPEAFGGIAGEDVHTEGDLEIALERAAVHTGPGPLLIEVHLDPLDVPDAFERMSAGLRSH
jgi:indolepyruvate decarboxylase